MVSEESVIQTIVEKTSVSKEEIENKVNTKLTEFAGLVSKLGAIYIVGKELGIDLVKPMDKGLKIKNIVPDMRNVIFVGKIADISPVRKFETDKGEGKVVNITFGDETGTIRLSLWNEKTDAVSKIKKGQVFEILGGYTKKDYMGYPEVRLGKYGNLRKIDADIKVKEGSIGTASTYKNSLLSELSEDEFVGVNANLLQIYERQLIHSLCPKCKEKLENSTCKKHGKVVPSKFIVLSGVLDDGYGTINAVFFRKSAEDILRGNINKIENKIQSMGETGFFDSLTCVGEQFNIKGVVRRNALMKNLELVVHKVKKIDVVEECNKLLEKVG